jgi:hypothetical protein
MVQVKYFTVLLIAILVAVTLALYNSDERSNSGESDSDEPLTGLPWQIDRLPDGDTRVFGITPGRTTLGDAINLLGSDMELAIIAAPRETGSLEAYYSRHSFGPITGKLILVMDITPTALSSMRQRAFREAGTRRHRLHPDDLPAAHLAPVKVITFLPSLSLDDDIARTRFGAPAEIIQVNAQEKHWIYPELGLDLVLNTDGKDVLQYMQPGELDAHRSRLQQAPPGSE